VVRVKSKANMVKKVKNKSVKYVGRLEVRKCREARNRR
jgi:hypothetical protein